MSVRFLGAADPRSLQGNDGIPCSRRELREHQIEWRDFWRNVSLAGCITSGEWHLPTLLAERDHTRTARCAAHHHEREGWECLVRGAGQRGFQSAGTEVFAHGL